MKTPDRIFRGKIESPRILLDLQAEFCRLIHSLDKQDVEVVLRKRRNKRSLSANSYYWGVVVALISEHLGYLPEEAHSALKERFLRDRINEKHGMLKLRSSADLDTGEFTEYVESCRRLAAELGVNIPDPGRAE